MTKDQEQTVFNHFMNVHALVLLTSDFHEIELCRGDHDRLTRYFWQEHGYVLTKEDFNVIESNL